MSIPKTRILFYRGRWCWQNSYGFDQRAYEFCRKLNKRQGRRLGFWG